MRLAGEHERSRALVDVGVRRVRSFLPLRKNLSLLTFWHHSPLPPFLVTLSLSVSPCVTHACHTPPRAPRCAVGAAAADQRDLRYKINTIMLVRENRAGRPPYMLDPQLGWSGVRGAVCESPLWPIDLPTASHPRVIRPRPPPPHRQSFVASTAARPRRHPPLPRPPRPRPRPPPRRPRCCLP